MDKYIIDTRNAVGYKNFYKHCCLCYRDRDVKTLEQVLDYELAQQFGLEYPRVRVKYTRTQGSYLRFRTEAEYTLFVLKWAV